MKRILSRMIDAGRSMNRRDFSQRRKSITAGQFAVVGWLLAKSWTSPEKKKSDVSLESQSLSETAISAPIVEQKDTTAKVEGYILSSDVDPTESVEAN